MMRFNLFRKQSKKSAERIPAPRCEPLEPRLLMAFDLTAAFSAFGGGASEPAGTDVSVDITLHNAGPDVAKGSSSIAFFAFPDGTVFDKNTATPLNIAKASGTIASGDDVLVSLLVKGNPSMPAGTYRIAGILDPNNLLVNETDKTNNTFTSDPIVITQPDYDIAPAFAAKGNVVLPAYVSGVGGKGSASVVISGSGADALPNGVTVSVSVVARPVGALDDTQDVVLNTKAVLAKLPAAGKTTTAKVALTFPAGLADGTYNIVGIIDSTDKLAESNEDNNEVTLGQTVIIAPAFVNLDLGIVNLKAVLPDATSGDGTKMSIPINVTNLGNVPVTAGQKVSAKIIAHRVSDDAEFDVQTISGLAVGGLKPGAFKALKLATTLPPGIPAGSYLFKVVLDSSNVVVESDETNVATTDAGNPTDVQLGTVNLVTTINNTTLPPAAVTGTNVAGAVSINIANSGNVPLPKLTAVDIAVVLRPTGGGADIPIGSKLAQKIGGLAAGAAKPFAVPVVADNTIAAGDYDIVVTVTPTAALTETDANDNEATGSTITFAAAFTDLQLVTATDSFAASTLGNSAGTGAAVIKNLGNVNATGTVKVEYFATVGGVFDGSEQSMGSKIFPVSLKPGASSAALVVPVSLPNATGGVDTAFTIVAKVTPVTLITDNNAANDTATSGTVTATPVPPNPADILGAMTFTEDTFHTTTAPVVGKITTFSNGTWTSTTGRTGGYLNWQVNFQGSAAVKKTPVFQFAFATGPELPANVGGGISVFFMVFNSAGAIPERLGGKTITFTATQQPNSIGHVGDLVDAHSLYAGGLSEVPLAFFSIS